MLLVLLFFVCAMGFSIYCWFKHDGVLGLLSFLLWFLFTFHSFGLSATRWDLPFGFGIFGTLMGIITIFTSIFMIIQKQTLAGEIEEPKEEDYVTRVAKHRERINEAVRKRRGSSNREL